MAHAGVLWRFKDCNDEAVGYLSGSWFDTYRWSHGDWRVGIRGFHFGQAIHEISGYPQ